MPFNIQNKNRVQRLFKAKSLSFIKNIGQLDEKIKYSLNISDLKIYFTEKSISFSTNINAGEVFNLLFQHNENCTIEGSEPCLLKTNYIFGMDSSKWYTNIPSFKKIVYKNIFSKTDLTFSLLDNCLKYEIVIHPGGDICRIEKLFYGFTDCALDETGNIIIHFNDLVLIDKKPICYQIVSGINKYFDCSFNLDSNDGIKTYGFKISHGFDENQDITIDPGLVYSTFLGGSDIDMCAAVAGDSYGNMYTAGDTYSMDFPYRPNNPWPFPPESAFQPSLHGQCNIFVTKFNPIGEAEFSTYIGGSQLDQVLDMAVDDDGNIFVAGFTTSPNFPHTSLFVTALNGTSECFVIKLTPAGSTVTYSTLIGGSNPNAGYGLSIDDFGSAYVVGYTKSNDFPLVNASQQNFGGSCNGFVTKLDANGSALLYSTYIGGTGGQYFSDLCYDIYVIRNTGEAYVCGATQSVDFPIYPTPPAPPPLQPLIKGLCNTFIARYSPAGVLEYSTYFGGSDADAALGIYADSNGMVYITGYTTSVDFPGTFYPPVTPVPPMQQKAFISKINLNANLIIYSLITGTNGRDNGNRITVDINGNAYVAGLTSSSDFPVTGSAYQTSLLGTQDAFLVRVTPSGDRFDYATYLGGNPNAFGEDIDSATSIFYMGNSMILTAGMTSSPDFPATAASPPTSYPAFQPVLGGMWDGFVTELIMTSPPIWPAGSTLNASNIEVTTLSLNWSPASDPAGIIRYAIYKDGILIGTVAGNVLNFNVTGLIENTTYTFKVEAENPSLVWTTDGPSVQASTLPDTTPPEWPEGTALGTVTSVTLSWPPLIDPDGVPIIAYEIYSNGQFLDTVGANTLSYTVTGIQVKTNYTFHILAVNRAGLTSVVGLSANYIILAGNAAPFYNFSASGTGSPGRGYSIEDLKNASYIAEEFFKN